MPLKYSKISRTFFVTLFLLLKTSYLTWQTFYIYINLWKVIYRVGCRTCSVSVEILLAVFCSLGTFSKLQKETISFVTSIVCWHAWKNSAPIGHIFMKFYNFGFSKYLLRKFTYICNMKWKPMYIYDSTFFNYFGTEKRYRQKLQTK